MESPYVSGAFAVFSGLAEEAAKTIFSKTLSFLKNKNDINKANFNIEQIYKKISTLRNVKTIWQIDREVDIYSFYCPTKILDNKNNKKVIDSLSDLLEGRNLVLEGTVGLGKSIFLRYLASRELQTGKIVPIFVELRNISSKNNLENLILDRLKRWGFPEGRHVLDNLLNNNKAVLFFDGFDEINDEFKNSVLNDIEALAEIYVQVRIIITSRPGEPIQKSAQFRVIKISNIDADDLPFIISKLYSGNDQASDLINKINEIPIHVQHVITTPLMVTLLILSFKSSGKIPQTIHDFYESIFNTLIVRHDGCKPGYKRIKKSKLSDLEIRKVFEAFCFFSKQQKLLVFSNHVASQLADNAIKHVGCYASADDFIEDIKKITCLLIEESGFVHFLHKSVQEFFCSCLIRNLSENKSKEFYQKIFDSGYDFWKHELYFLKYIDSFRYAKMLDFPAREYIIIKIWKKIPKEYKAPSKAGLERLLNECYWLDRPSDMGGNTLFLPVELLLGCMDNVYFPTGVILGIVEIVLSGCGPFTIKAISKNDKKNIVEINGIKNMAKVYLNKKKPLIGHFFDEGLRFYFETYKNVYNFIEHQRESEKIINFDIN